MTTRLHTSASRHPGSEASRQRAAASSRRVHVSHARAFSLIEVLLAIFILGIGVISIAALFPAGIAQQRLSVDEMMGPAVVGNAMTVIRSKVRAEDFGTFEDFTPVGDPLVRPPRPTVYGDWTWLRPGFVFGDHANFPPPPLADTSENGAIDIFSYYSRNGSEIPAQERATEFPDVYPNTNSLRGIPYNTVANPTEPPRILITQRERYYPQAPMQYTTNNDAVKPQYVWDCMFRRFQGKIQVAVFVYRVTAPGGGPASNYIVTRNSASSGLDQRMSPLPMWVPLDRDIVTGGAPPYSAGEAWDSYGPDGIGGSTDDAIVLGTENGTQYNPDNPTHAWQEPRQWIVDQNNNVHRVLGLTLNTEPTTSTHNEVELVRPLTPVMGRVDASSGNSLPTNTHFYYKWQPATGTSATFGWIHTDIVTDIWYIPLIVDADFNGDGNIDGEWILTPVYAAVKEL